MPLIFKIIFSLRKLLAFYVIKLRVLSKAQQICNRQSKCNNNENANAITLHKNNWLKKYMHTLFF